MPDSSLGWWSTSSANRSCGSLVLGDGQQAIVVGPAGATSTEMDGDPVVPATAFASAEFGFDVAFECLTGGFAPCVEVVDV